MSNNTQYVNIHQVLSSGPSIISDHFIVKRYNDIKISLPKVMCKPGPDVSSDLNRLLLPWTQNLQINVGQGDSGRQETKPLLSIYRKMFGVS